MPKGRQCFFCSLDWKLFTKSGGKKNRKQNSRQQRTFHNVYFQASCHCNMSFSGCSAFVCSVFQCFLLFKHLKTKYLHRPKESCFRWIDSRPQFCCLRGTQSETTEPKKVLGKCKEPGNNPSLHIRVCVYFCYQQGLHVKSLLCSLAAQQAQH